MVGNIGINKRSMGRISVEWSLVAITDNLACAQLSLKMFKTTLIARSAFLQLPRSIHTVLETVIEEE